MPCTYNFDTMLKFKILILTFTGIGAASRVRHVLAGQPGPVVVERQTVLTVHTGRVVLTLTLHPPANRRTELCMQVTRTTTKSSKHDLRNLRNIEVTIATNVLLWVIQVEIYYSLY